MSRTLAKPSGAVILGYAMRLNRRTAMRVRDGRVLKKNNWRLDPGNYRAVPQSQIRLVRERPREGTRHLITIAQLRQFIELLPEWDEVAIGLDAIILDAATDCDGWYAPGGVAICAWDHDLWWWSAEDFVDEHREVLELVDVERVPLGDSAEYQEMSEFPGIELPSPTGYVELRWTEPQARAYQLLHILPHELGHHHDRMTSRRQRTLGRGEPYAEAYANRVLHQVWPKYVRAFEL
jgi:hypothetical protein